MSLLDNIIIILFFAAIILFSLYQNKSLKNSRESYFLAGKNIHWIVAMLSIVATETSVLTFIGIPAMSYMDKDWNFLQVVCGYIVGRFLVSYLFLPMYYKEGIISIYQVVGDKFGKTIQKMAATTFLITRLFADGVRFLATAGIVNAITGWGLGVSILIIGTVTIFYSSIGGLKTILWVDGFQFFIYLACGLIAIFHITGHDLFDYRNIYENGFLDIVNNSSNLLAGEGLLISMLAGAFMSFGSHGIDYLMVQRVLSTKNIATARKAMIGSGFFVFIQFSVFLCVGTLILSGTFFDFSSIPNTMFSQNFKNIISPLLGPNIFPDYIRIYIPSGLKGLMLAGALSAAMSSLSSSINSLASSTIVDIFGKEVNLRESIKTSIMWGVILTIFCLIFDYGKASIIILSLKIASFTYGGLISLFIFVKLNISFSKKSIIVGYISSIAILLILAYCNVGWEYYIAISIASNFIIAYLSNLFDKEKA